MLEHHEGKDVEFYVILSVNIKFTNCKLLRCTKSKTNCYLKKTVPFSLWAWDSWAAILLLLEIFLDFEREEGGNTNSRKDSPSFPTWGHTTGNFLEMCAKTEFWRQICHFHKLKWSKLSSCHSSMVGTAACYRRCPRFKSQ